MLFIIRISQDGNKRLCRTWLLLLTNTLTNLSTKGLDMKIINIEYNDYGDIIYTIKPFKNRTRTIEIKVDRWNKGKKPVKCYINNDKFFSSPKIHYHQFSDINAPLSENDIKIYCKNHDSESIDIGKILSENNVCYKVSESLKGFEGTKMFEVYDHATMVFCYKPLVMLKKWLNDYRLDKNAVVWKSNNEFLLDCSLYFWDDVKNLNKICRNAYMRYASKLRRKYGTKEFKSKLKSFHNAPWKYRSYLKNSEQSNLKNLTLPFFNLRSDKLNFRVKWYALISEV